MTDAQNDANSAEADGDAPPRVDCVAQYLKDLSFENPSAPQAVVSAAIQPELSMEIDVEVERLGDTAFEVALRLSVSAKTPEYTYFVIDMTYAGVFQLVNIPPEQWRVITLIECPRILFPFARQIVANLTTQGGYPPVMLRMIDFASLYERNIQREQATAGTAEA